MRDQGNVRRLDPAVRQIHAGRGFRCPADAHKHDVSRFEVPRHLAVIMGKRVVDRCNPAELGYVHFMLGARLAAFLEIEEFREGLDERIEDGDRRRLKL